MKQKTTTSKPKEKIVVIGKEAEVAQKEWRGKQVVERRGFRNESLGGEGFNFYYRGLERFYAHKIAHLLFPEHFFEPIGQEGAEAKRNPKVILRSLPKHGDKLYQHFLDHFYPDQSQKVFCNTCSEHRKRVNSNAIERLRDEMARAGIHVNGHPANVGFKDGKPIFYELLAPGIEASKTREFLETLSDEKLKKKVLRYINRFDFHEKKFEKT